MPPARHSGAVGLHRTIASNRAAQLAGTGRARVSSAFALWWLALPVLLLPVWWHRQRRERSKAVLLATARFLPNSDPQHQRVWHWVDRALLLLRCLLLLLAIGWLADLALPWRGDSVLIVPGNEP